MQCLDCELPRDAYRSLGKIIDSQHRIIQSLGEIRKTPVTAGASRRPNQQVGSLRPLYQDPEGKT